MAEYLNSMISAGKRGLGKAADVVGDWANKPTIKVNSGGHAWPDAYPELNNPRPAEPLNPKLAGDAVRANGGASEAAAQLSKTSAGARTVPGGMSPEAAAVQANGVNKGAFTAEELAAGKSGVGYRAGKGLGSLYKNMTNASVLGRGLGGVQAGAGAFDALNHGLNADNATEIASGAAKFNPVTAGPALAFDAGKLAGRTLTPDPVAVGLAKAVNWLTGNGDKNNTESGLKVNQAEIDKVVAANPNGNAAKYLRGEPAAPVIDPNKAPATAAGTSASLLGNPAQPEVPGQKGVTADKILERLANLEARKPLSAPTRAASYRQAPVLDTAPVAGDSTGLATMANITAQMGPAANWAAGLKQAKHDDAVQMGYDKLNSDNENADRGLQVQGLGKAADMMNNQMQREMSMRKFGYEQRQDNEKRFEKRIEDKYGPAFDKDGKPNAERQKFETALNAYLDQAGVDKRMLDPKTFEDVMLAAESGAYDPKPGVGAQILQKMTDGSTSATRNVIDATTPTGDTKLGGMLVKTQDGRWKWGTDVYGGGTITDIFNPADREVRGRALDAASKGLKNKLDSGELKRRQELGN